MESTNEADQRALEQTEPRGRTRGASRWQFRAAVLRHHRVVYRLAFRLLEDQHEAEDVTHEAFLRYWQHGGDVRGPREWLLTVARNACLDRLRRIHRTVDETVAAPELLSDDHDPVWHLQQRELAARLKALIAALPEPQRSLVVLFDVQGLDGATCARVLGLNRNQVKVYLHRARRRLRRQLEKSL